MSYHENPKTRGSGILCAIPQDTRCPYECEDCFFQSGRSYLEPLDKNLPNIPPDQWRDFVVRVNDGNDSSVDFPTVMMRTIRFANKFYNTSNPARLLDYDAPVVLTINPREMTDTDFYKLEMTPLNLMFVRFRTNTWNQDLLRKAVEYYAPLAVPIVLTFMAYHGTADRIPPDHRHHYMRRIRTKNQYMAITTDAWRSVMEPWIENNWVYSCGKVEGERGNTHCDRCGNCLREYYVTMDRITRLERGDPDKPYNTNSS